MFTGGIAAVVEIIYDQIFFLSFSEHKNWFKKNFLKKVQNKIFTVYQI